MTQTKARLVRARWRCVILKVQLALQIQQLPTQQDNTAASEYDTQGNSWNGRYERKPSIGRKLRVMNHDFEYEFYNDYERRCEKPFQTAALTSMAVREVVLLEVDLSRLSRDLAD